MQKFITPILILFCLSCGSNTPLPESITFDQQVWMSKNLDVSTFANGEPIPEAKTDEEWKKAADNHQPAWCYFENDPDHATKYGKLYNYFAVTDPRGLAPKGWHIPNEEEWTLLINTLGGENQAGKKMRKKAYQENEQVVFGFCAEAGGYRREDGDFIGLGYYRNWWSNDSTISNIVSLNPYKNSIHRNSVNPGMGIAVRCIRN